MAGFQMSTEAGAPFDCTIVDVGKQVTTDQGAVKLQALLPKVLVCFGTRHVNLVGHSKGGLHIREFLQLNANLDPNHQIGVISATTLDTPHRGSVLASTVAHFNTAPISAAVIEFVRSLGAELGFLDIGANDMTPEALRVINQKYATPPDHFTLFDSNGNSSTTTPFYFSTSADADNNNDGKITGAEADPPYSPLFGNFAYQTIARGQPVTTLVTAGIRTVQSLPRDKPYVPNDCLVPVYSAQYVGFQEIHSYQLTDGRNHGTIREPDVATRVLQNITMAESQQH